MWVGIKVIKVYNFAAWIYGENVSCNRNNPDQMYFGNKACNKLSNKLYCTKMKWKTPRTLQDSF